MPFTGAAGDKNFSRTNGTYSGPTTWQQTEAGSRDILSLDEDIHDQDMAVAIDNSLQRNGDNHAIADIPMGGYKFTGLGAGINPGDSVSYQQVASASPFTMSGGFIQASVSGYTLTVALKHPDGSDPTTANPIMMQFHSYNPGNGLPQTIAVTSPLSFTLSAGSTLGTVPNTVFTLLVMAFACGSVDGQGPVRLALMKQSAISSGFNTGANSMHWSSATADDGAGGCDSGDMPYSSAAVGWAPYRIIGDIWFFQGLPSPGYWDLTASYVTTQAHTPALQMQSATPVGAVMPFAGSVIPPGWMLCNGQAISRSIYSLLFTVIGGYYGVGDGYSTFNVPNLMGRVVAHYDPGYGILYNTGLAYSMNGGHLGAVGGYQYHVVAAAELPAHQHYMDHTHATLEGGGFRTNPPTGGANSLTSQVGTNNGSDATTGAASTAYTGYQPSYGSAMTTQPPTFVLYYIIYAGQ